MLCHLQQLKRPRENYWPRTQRQARVAAASNECRVSEAACVRDQPGQRARLPTIPLLQLARTDEAVRRCAPFPIAIAQLAAPFLSQRALSDMLQLPQC